MRLSKKDRLDRFKGDSHRRYYCSCSGHADFTKQCRRTIRAKAKAALRSGREPLPKDPKRYEYFD